MTKMEAAFQETGISWTTTVWGEPIGHTWKRGSYGLDVLNRPCTLPTEKAARKVGKAFKKWIAARFPDKEEPGNQYFVAFASGEIKVFKCWRAESEEVRRSGLNHFRNQTDAHLAASALAWLCKQERDRFNTDQPTVANMPQFA